MSSGEQAFLGIEIGGTKLQVAAGTGSGAVFERFRFSVDRSRGAAGIREVLESQLPVLIAARKPLAVGVGFGGPVDWRSGRICCSHHVEGWSEFGLGEWLEQITRLPVVVDNDANVAALGEAACGAGAGEDPVFYVTLGSGVGGGLVAGGRIYHGATPGEAEIGHVRLDRQGTIVEARCAGWAVDRKIRELIARDPACRLAQLAGGREGGEARHLGTALAEGDPHAQRIIDETASDLAFALSHATHLFHPSIVVLGGGLSLVGEPLRAAVARALPSFVMAAFGAGPRVALALLGEDAVPVGALALAGRASKRAL
jgi:glucokinase